jgi:hypothetical protein
MNVTGPPGSAGCRAMGTRDKAHAETCVLVLLGAALLDLRAPVPWMGLPVQLFTPEAKAEMVELL